MCGKPGLTASATVSNDPVAMTEDNGSVSAIVPFKVDERARAGMPKPAIGRMAGMQGRRRDAVFAFAAGGIPALRQEPQKAGQRSNMRMRRSGTGKTGRNFPPMD